MLKNRCDKSVNITRKQEGTRGNLGSVKPITVTVASNVACMIQPRSGKVRRGEAGNETTGSHLMLLSAPTGYDILQGDVVVYGSTSYDVVFVGKFNHWEIDLTEAVR